MVPEELGKTLDQIIQKRQDHRVEVKTRWQLTDTPYDAWLLFGCMLALLSYEWYLRRRWSMV